MNIASGDSNELRDYQWCNHRDEGSANRVDGRRNAPRSDHVGDGRTAVLLNPQSTLALEPTDPSRFFPLHFHFGRRGRIQYFTHPVLLRR